MKDRLRTLVSFPFLACLILLLLNDFYLKATFHNAFTGKLSDFCGLFIFSVFWAAMFPLHKSWVYLLSGVLFIYWKSEYSSLLINVVSRYLFSVERTVDLSDLIALPVLGVAWFWLRDNGGRIQMHRFLKNLSPYPVAILAFFSFCATSRPHYVQTFEQPQYVLFRSAALPDSNQFEGDFNLYRFDSLLVVRVNQLYLSDRPAKDDDYSKNVAVKDLDKTVSGTIQGVKSLMPPAKITELIIKTPQGDDNARFKGGRLDGKFIRKKDGRILIDGRYKVGLEDSVWTIRDSTGAMLTRVTFVNGERTRVEQFKGGVLTSSASVYTRAEVIRNKSIQIAALGLLMIGCITLIIRNYRKQDREKFSPRSGWKWLVSLLSPFIVWMLQFVITQVLGDYQFDLLYVPFSIFLAFVITCPLFFIIVFGVKLSRDIDVLWYCIFFACAFSIWTEYGVLSALSA